MKSILHNHKSQIIEKINEGFSQRKLAKEFGVAVKTIVRFLKKENLKTNVCTGLRFCKVCSTELTGKQQHFCSKKCKYDFYYKIAPQNKRQNFVQTQKEKGRKRKIDLINLKGGKCKQCGYNKNIGALCFHHLNISEKEFDVCIRTITSKPYAKLVEEVNKCVLLCANCHQEIHYPELDNLL